jgi:hypothetical protein
VESGLFEPWKMDRDDSLDTKWNKVIKFMEENPSTLLNILPTTPRGNFIKSTAYVFF